MNESHVSRLPLTCAVHANVQHLHLQCNMSFMPSVLSQRQRKSIEKKETKGKLYCREKDGKEEVYKLAALHVSLDLKLWVIVANMWIADMFEGTGIAAATQQCAIQLPLSTKPLQHSFQVLKSVMKHNFFLCVFTMAGTVMA